MDASASPRTSPLSPSSSPRTRLATSTVRASSSTAAGPPGSATKGGVRARLSAVRAGRKIDDPVRRGRRGSMKRRLVAIGAVVAAAIAAAAVAATALGGGKAGGTILIGISTAKTGILAPYDLQASQLFEMRINQINKAGGVLGK